MKKLRLLLAFSFLGLAILLNSCKKDNNNNTEPSEDRYKGVAHGNVPSHLQNRVLQRGSVSVSAIWNTATLYHHSQETLQEFTMTGENGLEVEYFQGLTQYAGNSCYNIALAKYKGALKFEGNKMTWTPVEGEFKSKFCGSGVGQERKATKADLERASGVYYTKEEVHGGRPYLMLYTDPSLGDNFWVGSFQIMQ